MEITNAIGTHGPALKVTPTMHIGLVPLFPSACPGVGLNRTGRTLRASATAPLAENPLAWRVATAQQGLKFRRNSAKNFVFATYREKKFGIFRKISFENSKIKKFRPKVTEIRRNLPKFRNEISFPLNTGICNENEMVNPARAHGPTRQRAPC